MKLIYIDNEVLGNLCKSKKKDHLYLIEKNLQTLDKYMS